MAKAARENQRRGSRGLLPIGAAWTGLKVYNTGRSVLFSILAGTAPCRRSLGLDTKLKREPFGSTWPGITAAIYRLSSTSPKGLGRRCNGLPICCWHI